MDPNANLSEIRGLILKAEVLETEDKSLPSDDSDRLVELVNALDEWMTAGGFLPRHWMVRRDKRAG